MAALAIPSKLELAEVAVLEARLEPQVLDKPQVAQVAEEVQQTLEGVEGAVPLHLIQQHSLPQEAEEEQEAHRFQGMGLVE